MVRVRVNVTSSGESIVPRGVVRVRVNVMSSGEWIVPRGVVRVRVNVTSSGESSRLYHVEWSEKQKSNQIKFVLAPIEF